MDTIRVNLDLGLQTPGPMSRGRTAGYSAFSTRGGDGSQRGGGLGATSARSPSASPARSPDGYFGSEYFDAGGRAQTTSSTLSPTNDGNKKDTKRKPKNTATKGRPDNNSSIVILPGMLGATASPGTAEGGEKEVIDLSELFNVPFGFGYRAKTSSPLHRGGSNLSAGGLGLEDSNSLSKSMSSMPTTTQPWNGASPVKLVPLSTGSGSGANGKTDLSATAPAAVTDLLQTQKQKKHQQQQSKKQAAASDKPAISQKAMAILSKANSRPTTTNNLSDNTYFNSFSLAQGSMISNLTENSVGDLSQSIDMNTLEALFRDSDIDGGSYLVADKLKKEARLNISALTGPLSKLSAMSKRKKKLNPAPSGAADQSDLFDLSKSMDLANKPKSSKSNSKSKKLTAIIHPNTMKAKSISTGAFLFPGLLHTDANSGSDSAFDINGLSAMIGAPASAGDDGGVPNIAPVPLNADNFS
jgi:hypothetical protein